MTQLNQPTQMIQLPLLFQLIQLKGVLPKVS